MGKKKSKEADSPTLALLRHVYGKTSSAPGATASWDILNRAMAAAMKLAIEAHFRFDLDDFKTSEEELGMGYWAGQDGGYGEWFYGLACGVNNVSAARAFEHWKERGPYIHINIQTWNAYGNTFSRKKGRVAVGTWFYWQGDHVRVTSIGSDHLIACAYREEWAWHGKPVRRFRITRQELLAARREGRRNDGRAADPQA